MGTPLIEFLTSISAFEIGLLLFFLAKKPKLKKFADSMTILTLIINPATWTIQLLAEYKGFIYFFLPIYLVAINGWLFFTRYVIFDNDWQAEDDAKKGVRKVYLILAFGFVAVLILLIEFVPNGP